MDHYAALGVRPNSPTDEINDQFRMLTRLYQSNEDDERTERRLREIRDAYDVLSDPAKRLRYDRLRSGSVTAVAGPEIPEAQYVPAPTQGGYDLSRRLAIYALAVVLLVGCLVVAIRRGFDASSRNSAAASVSQISPR